MVQPIDRVDCGLCWNERREVRLDRPGTQNWYGRLRQALRARSTQNQYQLEVGTTRDQGPMTRDLLSSTVKIPGRAGVLRVMLT